MLSAISPKLPVLVIVMGVSGCGKTSLAKSIAKSLSFNYVEADDFHSPEAVAMMRNQIPIDDTIRTAWVARLKTHLTQQREKKQHVTLAFSGLRRAHRETIEKSGFFTLTVFLNGDKAVIAERMNARKNHYMPASLLDSQFQALEIPKADQNLLTLGIDIPQSEQLQQALAFINTRITTI